MSSKQLQTAVAYVSGAWIPVNSLVLDEVQEGLRSGRYADSPLKLFHDLKRDLSLFMFVLRKSSEILRAQVDPLTGAVDPVKIFSQVPLAEFERILAAPPAFISRHRIEQSSSEQANCLLRATVAATVTSHIAKQRTLDPQFAYAAALFRELGLALIAWNYPSIYQRTVNQINPHQSLDQALSNVLGFTPGMLAVTIVRNWAISPKICYLMGDKTSIQELDPESVAVCDTLSELCRSGEALARVAAPPTPQLPDPESLPLANELAEQLGQNSFTDLLSALRQNLIPYLKSAPDVFQLPELLDRPLPAAAKTTPIKPNRYVASCPGAVVDLFNQVYAKTTQHEIKKEALDILSKQIAPRLGFSCGSVFLVEPDSLTLAPRLPIGSVRANYFTPVNYSAMSEQWNCIVAAFRSALPIAEEHDNPSVKQPSFIAAYLGRSRRAGVLYLELSPELSADSNANPLVYFKAIREAFDDCLGFN